jgi:hypothetical protein
MTPFVAWALLSLLLSIHDLFSTDEEAEDDEMVEELVGADE